MWTGIVVEDHGILKVHGSTINDAQYAIDAYNGCSFAVNSSTFNEDFVGINIRPAFPLFNAITYTIDDCTFNCSSNLRSPFAGQTPTPGLKTFAGVQFADFDMDLSSNGNTMNHFQNLSNGIVGEWGNLIVKDCDFKNIQPDNQYNFLASNGNGIFLDGGPGFFNLTQEGFGFNSGQTSFDNCYRGIYTRSAGIHSTGNIMMNMTFGYRTEFGSLHDIDILLNHIECQSDGIFLNLNDGANHLLVEGNHIFFGAAGGIPHMCGIRVGESTGVNPDSRINSNVIWFNQGSLNSENGILLKAATGYQVTQNEIHIPVARNTYGINTSGSFKDLIGCNRIYGPGSSTNFSSIPMQSSIRIFQGDAHIVSCNTTDVTANGIYQEGTSNIFDLSGNEFHYHQLGLRFGNFSAIPNQDFKGNTWPLGAGGVAPGGLGARASSPTMQLKINLNAAPFGICTPPFPLYFPPTLFQPSGLNINFQCAPPPPPVSIPYCSQFHIVNLDDYDHAFDERIARELIENGDFTDPSRYELEKKLWQELRDNPSFRDSFPVLDSFYVANLNGLLALVDQVNQSSSTLQNINPQVLQNINNNLVQIRALNDSIKYTFAMMMNDSTTLSQFATESNIIQSLQQNIQNLLIYNKTAMDVALNSKILNADNIKAVNDAINANDEFETNEKIVNEIYLSTIAKGIIEFTSSQAADLLRIAQQCPLAGGNAVWRARVLYALVDDEMTYDDVTTCLGSGIVLRRRKDPDNLDVSTSIYPNPTTHEINLVYDIGRDEPGMFVVMDALGVVVFQHTLDSKAHVFTTDLSSFAPSVYHYKVISGNRLIGVGKISVMY